MLARLAALMMASAAASSATAATQSQLDQLASRMGIRLTILDNKPATCPRQANGYFSSQLDLTMPQSLAPDLAASQLQCALGAPCRTPSADSSHLLRDLAGARV